MSWYGPGTSIKRHSQLWDRADLDTGFLTLKKVHPNLKSIGHFRITSGLFFEASLENV